MAHRFDSYEALAIVFKLQILVDMAKTLHNEAIDMGLFRLSNQTNHLCYP